VGTRNSTSELFDINKGPPAMLSEVICLKLMKFHGTGRQKPSAAQTDKKAQPNGVKALP